MQVQKTEARKLLSTENCLSIPVRARENGEKNAEPFLLIHPMTTQGKAKAQLPKDCSYFTGHLPFTWPAEGWKCAITSAVADPARPVYSRWPPFARGDGEEREQSPEHVVVVELVFFPFPGLRLHLIFFIIEVLTPRKNRVSDQMRELNQISHLV